MCWRTIDVVDLGWTSGHPASAVSKQIQHRIVESGRIRGDRRDVGTVDLQGDSAFPGGGSEVVDDPRGVPNRIDGAGSASAAGG